MQGFMKSGHAWIFTLGWMVITSFQPTGSLNAQQGLPSGSDWSSRPIQQYREPTRFAVPPSNTSSSNIQPASGNDVQHLHSEASSTNSYVMPTSLQSNHQTVATETDQRSIQQSSSYNAPNQNMLESSRDTDKKLTKLPAARKPELISGKASVGGWRTLITTLFALMVVLALFVAFAAFTKRAWSGSKGTLPKQVFELLGKTAYAPRQQMMVVRFGSKVLLINHELGNVQTLSEIADPEEVDRIVGQFEQQSSSSISNSFGQVLNQVIQGTRDKGASRKPILGRFGSQAVVRKVA